jgi:uncharacterized protein YndB with AHSA1/START domain
MTITNDDARSLTLTRYIAAPPEKVYRAWTDSDVLKRWFAPRPYTTPHAELDVRPGGSSIVVMRGPDGVDMPSRGVYLHVEPNRRLVVTDAFTEAWRTSGKAFMLLDLTFATEGEGTRYTAIVRHWSTEDRDAHERMGFDVGWNAATDQLEEVIATL